MKDKDRLYRLMARKLAGEATAGELFALEQAIKDDPELAFQLEIITTLWKAEPAMIAATGEEAGAERLLDKLKRLPDEKPAWKKQERKISVVEKFINAFHVLTHFFTISRRILFRNKAFSFTNITGLAIGMAGAVLILLWIQNEWSYDQFHEKKDRIYEAYNRVEFEGQLECWNTTAQPLAPALVAGYPQVEQAVRMNWVGAFVFHAADKNLETQGFIADPGFLTMFDFPLLEGNTATALQDIHSVVLTAKMARRLFGNENAMGKTIRVDSLADFTVTGIMKDLPNNTRFNFEYLISWSYMKEVHWDRDNWENSIHTYVLLKQGVNAETANDRIRTVAKLHAADAKNDIFLHPLSKWRLWSEFENGKVAGGRIETVRLFGVIAIFLLLIACINYMNLSTARSEKRGKEVGLRKVMGAGKGSLVGQFMTESIFIAFLAGVIALIIVTYSIPWFNELTGKALFVPYNNFYFWLAAIAFILFTGVIAGSYPAFYLSAFKPIKILKGQFKGLKGHIRPRKILVVVQFSFAIALIICTIIIYRQINYTQDRDAGYDRNNLAFVFAKGDVLKNYAVIRGELLQSDAITSITRTNSPITSIWNDDGSYEWAGKDPNAKPSFIKIYADKDYGQTMGLRLLAGRDINIEKYPGDSTAILLNETAARLMHFKEPIGQPVKNGEGNWHVVGVVKDFIAGAPFARVDPTIIQGPGPGYWFGTVSFRLNTKYSTPENLAKIKAVFARYNPDYPFDYYFADTEYAAKFLDQQQTGKLAAIFAGLTIFISCLGLFALATYTAESRIKEIGVRKVLGASVAHITTLISGDFLRLVIISFLIASPVAWWSMHHWLQNYSYHVTISWWVFAVTGLLSVMIAVLTISYQAIRAATADPVVALRNE